MLLRAKKIVHSKWDFKNSQYSFCKWEPSLLFWGGAKYSFDLICLNGEIGLKFGFRNNSNKYKKTIFAKEKLN